MVTFLVGPFFTNEAVPLFHDFIKGKTRETFLTELRRGRYLRGRHGTKMWFCFWMTLHEILNQIEVSLSEVIWLDDKMKHSFQNTRKYVTYIKSMKFVERMTNNVFSPRHDISWTRWDVVSWMWPHYGFFFHASDLNKQYYRWLLVNPLLVPIQFCIYPSYCPRL